jgi:hypothetical protein
VTSTSEVVAIVRKIVELEELGILELRHLHIGKSPSPIGMIDGRDSTGSVDGIDVILQGFHFAVSMLRFDELCDVERVQMNGDAIIAIRNLLSRDQEKIVGLIRIERFDVYKHIVICDHEKVITVVFVPFYYI